MMPAVVSNFLNVSLNKMLNLLHCIFNGTNCIINDEINSGIFSEQLLESVLNASMLKQNVKDY